MDLRVLYLIDSLARGGAEQSLVSMAPHLIQGGVDLHVGYFLDRTDLVPALRHTGAHVHALSGSGGRWARARQAAEAIRRIRPGLVHTTLFEADIAGRIAARRCGVPVVSSLVNLAYGPDQRTDPRISAVRLRAAQGLDMLTARLVVRFHAISAHVADVMSRRLRIDRRKVEVIPRGRDPEQLGTRTPERRAAARAELGVADDAPLLLAAARHEYQKGLDVLLRAMPAVLAEIPAARLFVAGREGNLTPTLREIVRDRGLEEAVRFLGVRDDVPDLLCAADLFVVPSRWEGLGSVLLEAMALECPIVASDLPAIRETAGPQHAAHVPPDRPDALASAMVRTLRDPAAASRARRARERFGLAFTVQKIAATMATFYLQAGER